MPLIKLFGIAIRSMSKPISAYVKNHLQDSPLFAKVMTGVGRKYQRAVNFMTSTKFEQLNQNRAITLGSEIVVEGLFFGLGGGLVIYDHMASKEKSAQLNERITKIEEACKNVSELREQLSKLEDNKKTIRNGWFY